MILDLNNHARDVPLGGVVTHLVLHQHCLTHGQPGEDAAVLVQLLHVGDGSLGKRPLPVLPQHHPLRPWLVSHLRGREKVSQISAKDHLSWTQLSVPVWSVPISHQGLEKPVICEATVPVCVLSDESLHTLDPELCPAVGVGEGGGGDSVVDLPVGQEFLGFFGGKFFALITGNFLRNAICRKYFPQMLY